MSVGNIFNIPHFIVSETPEGLRDKMLENNALFSTEFNYYSIVYDGTNFVAFYYKLAEESNFLLKKKRTIKKEI